MIEHFDEPFDEYPTDDELSKTWKDIVEYTLFEVFKLSQEEYSISVNYQTNGIKVNIFTSISYTTDNFGNLSANSQIVNADSSLITVEQAVFMAYDFYHNIIMRYLGVSKLLANKQICLN